jgi:putative DNA primase/helicase
MTWANHDEVISQMRGLGLDIQHLDIGKMRRCKVEGDKEQRGWYMLHELRLDDGDTVLVGSYGIWRGNENNAQKIELTGRKMTDDQRAALKKSWAADKARVDLERKATAAKAARRASEMWNKLAPIGSCQYLETKGVQGHGLRYHEGVAYIPMQDVQGSIHGLQVLLPKGHKRIEQTGRNKDFWPVGLIKKGHYFQLGSIRDIVLIAEGYATAASLFEATQLPVIVAFDAGNLMPVAEAIKKRHRAVKMLICADDDFKSEGNPGMSSASAAALSVNGSVIAPIFTISREVGKKGLTDFNDLHLGEGLHTVRNQVEARIEELKWRVASEPRVGLPQQGGGDGQRGVLKSMLTLDESLQRFALVYGGGGTMFDFDEHILVPKSDVLDILPEHGWRDLRAIKRVVRMDEVGFDPAESDKRIICNLWGGWPTTPKQGQCERLLELLEYLCSEEENSRTAFEWCLKWLAYPIQHPGAKMRTALVFHGPQGTGKNLFFEAIMAIYGEYGRIVDQSAVEDKFNDWASKKLFMIADEVVARQELFHVKNKLKGFVTGEWIRINPKNVSAHDERNHVNLVFLSNESHPLVLEKDDRRYAVIHTPEKLSMEFYQSVRDEINAGGIAALHDYLLRIDLGDFDEHTKPPITKAKQDLIEIGMDSVQQFIGEWISGRLDMPVCPVGSKDLYETYCWFCRVNGERSARSSKQFIGTIKHLPRWNYGEENRFAGTKKVVRGTIIPPDEVLAKYETGKQDTEQRAAWLTRTCQTFTEAMEQLQ